MALFIFGLIPLIGFIVAVGYAVIAPEERGPALGIAAVLVVIAFLCIFFSMYRMVGAREVGVAISNGRLQKPLGSGIHFTAPWVSVTSCPLSEEYSIQNADPNTGTAQYNQSVPIAGQDGGSATADVTVAYHIDARDVDTAYRLYRCDLARIRDYAIAQRVRSDVAQAATSYVSTDLRANRQGIEKGSLGLLHDELSPQGITVDSVTIADMQLSSQAQTAADNKVAATNALGVANIKNQQAQIDKNTALTNAQAEQAANAAKAQSLSQAILCQQFIQAVAQSKITVLNTAGPCSSVPAAGGGTSVLVNPNG